jgi:hypothetical protein
VGIRANARDQRDRKRDHVGDIAKFCGGLTEIAEIEISAQPDEQTSSERGTWRAVKAAFADG